MRTIPIEERAAEESVTPVPTAGAAVADPGHRFVRVVLVGSPNVGKSSLFRRLTGRYAAVSNYPGTSVELTRGHAHIGPVACEVVDTPGLHSLLPSTEEERVTRRLLIAGEADVVVHVVDAKNVALQLPLTLQLLEIGCPVVLALNIADEAERLGVIIRDAALAERLGVPVVPVVAVTGAGMRELRHAILDAMQRPVPTLPEYGNGVGQAIRQMRNRLSGTYGADYAAVGALLLQGDSEIEALVSAGEADGGVAARRARDLLVAGFGAPAPYRIAAERQRAATALLEGVVEHRTAPNHRWVDRFGRALSRPLVGVPVLLLVLYLGLYQFVGVFGGGVVVDWLETVVFEQRLNPLLERLFAGIPWEPVRALYVGDYGLLTLGVRYAVAIILPIVGAFFLFFSILEDSGYFPRLALLLDRVFKKLGLSGRAVIPMVLGFACDTMATMVTRTLETRRERVLATLLLALAVPCSAQLGVILALLAGSPLALGTWTVAITGSFLLVGWLGGKLMPGASAPFQMEVPPLRRPRLANVLLKTVTRMQWYFLEVLPLFLLASIILWALDQTGLFGYVVAGMQPVLGALGLPAETASVFLLGFFRRDYGAAGLFDLSQAGALDAVQIAVAAVTLTLFVPCVAQFLMMFKERGPKTAFGMLAFITPFAFGVGFVVNLVLRSFV
ncbi:MAG: ferrous iron transport protein B [Gemmatimonadota bacterium]|nr:ferrous iron transport protein B [Gemmatimonadota bacterium]